MCYTKKNIADEDYNSIVHERAWSLLAVSAVACTGNIQSFTSSRASHVDGAIYVGSLAGGIEL